MLGKLLFPLSAGIASALLFLSPTLISVAGVVLVYLAPLPIAITGFAHGLTAATISAAVSALSVGFVLISSGALPGLYTVLLISIYAPVLLIMCLALKQLNQSDGTAAWYPVGNILSWLTCLGLGVFLLAAALMTSTDAGFRGSTERVLFTSIGILAGKTQEFDPTITAGLKEIVPMIAKTVPSTIINTWMIILPILNCVLAHRMVSAHGKSIRPRPQYRGLNVSIWLLPVVGLGVLLSTLNGELEFLGLNLLLISSIPFFFIGLAVLHSISMAWPGRPIVLTGIYITLVLTHWPAVILVAAGVLEHWLRLRDRMKSTLTHKGDD